MIIDYESLTASYAPLSISDSITALLSIQWQCIFLEKYRDASLAIIPNYVAEKVPGWSNL